MNITKKCTICGRYYRGSGFKEVCTSSCYSNHEYALKHNRQEYVTNLYEKKPKKEVVDVIKQANDKWMNYKKPEPKCKKQLNRINHLMNINHLKNDEWNGKKFKSIRG